MTEPHDFALAMLLVALQYVLAFSHFVRVCHMGDTDLDNPSET